MKDLQLKDSVKSRLAEIIDNAISKKMIDTEELRMIVLKPGANFDALEVYFSNEWDEYYDHYYNRETEPLGIMDISSWLDIADQQLEIQDQLSDDYNDKAREYNKKYLSQKAAIRFDHIPEGKYKNFLICLREELLSQIEKAVMELAIDTYTNTFAHLVGFISYRLVYNDSSSSKVIAFTHENGAAPFYNVLLSLPDFKLTYPYLKFSDSGFTLFYPKGNKLDDDVQEESNVYEFNTQDINYAYLPTEEDREVTFRLKTEFEDWKLRGGHINDGDLSEEEFFDAFKGFLLKNKKILFDKENVPHPIKEEQKFVAWISHFIVNNQFMSFSSKERIVKLGEQAINKALELIPITHQDHYSLKRVWAGELYDSENYSEVVDLLLSTKNLTDHYKLHILQAYYFLNDKKEFEDFYNTLDVEKLQDALLLRWLSDIKSNAENSEELRELEKNIQQFIEDKKDLYVAGNGWLALTRLYIVLGEEENAVHAFKNVDLTYLNLLTFSEKEFQNDPLILSQIKKYKVWVEQKSQTDQWIKDNALILPDDDEFNFDKVPYETCYVLNKEFETGFKWVRPLSESIFIAHAEDEIYLGEFSSDYSIEKKSVIELDSDKSYNLNYQEESLCLASEEEGIILYSIVNNQFEQTGIVANKNSKAKYKCATLNGTLLYTCNDDSLEIFDLSVSYTQPILEDFYIDNAYWMQVVKDLLVINCGPKVLLLDIKEPAKPKILSAIDGMSTKNDGEIIIVDDHLIATHTIDIKDPENPRNCGKTFDEVASVYDFSSELPEGVYATSNEYLLKQFDPEKDAPLANWIECLDSERKYNLRVYDVKAVLHESERIIVFTDEKLSIFQKEEHPSVHMKFDIQSEVSEMVAKAFDRLATDHPDFLIGKVVLKHYTYIVDLDIHYCSSFPLMADKYGLDHQQPLFNTNLNLESYVESHTKSEYIPEFCNFLFDTDEIFREIVESVHFKKQAARNVMVIVNDKVETLHSPEKEWKPFRTKIEDDKDESALGILSGGNENLILELKKKINQSQEIVDELLDIVNFKEDPSPSKKETMTSKEIGNTKEGEVRTSEFISPPQMKPLSEDKKIVTDSLKKMALKLLSRHEDRAMFKEVLLNGAKYGIARPALDSKVKAHIDLFFLEMIVSNYWGLLKEFGNEEEVKTFLYEVLDKDVKNEIKAKIAVHYQLWDHPSISAYIKELMDYNGFAYHDYVGDSRQRGIDFSQLPREVFQPLEASLLEIYHQYLEGDEEQLDWKIKNSIVTTFAMLYKLGHKEFPDVFLEKVESAKKYREKYEDDFLFDDDEDDYEDEEAFLLRIYRESIVGQVIDDFDSEGNNPIWKSELKPEPYKKSWYNTFDMLIIKGVEKFGEKFKNDLIDTLCTNISLGEEYENDRIMALNFVHYVFKRIIEQPGLASLVAPLIEKIEAHKDLFKKELNIKAIKEKVKYTLLQDAWNDLKEGKYEKAEKKADGLLAMDSDLGQVYFLKARLMWLQEGIDVYLQNREIFIEKASHDPAALGRLYNLTGCALDVKEEYEEALSYFLKAAQTSPNDVILYANIAEVYYKMKNPEKAVYYAKKTKEKGGTSEMADEIIRNEGVMAES